MNKGTPQGKKKKKALASGFTLFLLLLFGFVLFVKKNFVIVEVRGDSMDPTFHQGQRLLVCKAYWLVGDLKKDDIVVAQGEEDVIIKRVYAKGGEVVDYYHVPENYSLLQGEYVVPQDHIYVLGDNRPVSEDSRIYGPISEESVIGKVVALKAGFAPTAEAKRKEIE